MMYLAFLFALPIHRPIAYICYVAAIIANIFDRKQHGKSSKTWQYALTDEDSLTLCNLLALIFCGKIYSAILISTLVIWAMLNIFEAGHHLAKEKIAFTSWKKCFEWARLNRFKLVQLKCSLEVFVCVTSPFAWILFALCAPLLPITYVQIVRLKYVTSPFTRDCFCLIDAKLS
jgi:hypothetical protein